MPVELRGLLRWCALCMQVLNLAGNQLQAVPSDVGWLGLKELNINGNPHLHIPSHVMHGGLQ